jgi:3-phenylpropionate/trans-cinnamate dioxygenase ferredoxin subunit
MTTRWIDVGALSDLQDGPIRAEVDGWPVAVARIDGALHAYEDRCTHDGETLAGAEVEDGALICPRHGARFCLRTGEALTPPAYEPIRIFAVRERDGRIDVGLAE